MKLFQLYSVIIGKSFWTVEIITLNYVPTVGVLLRRINASAPATPTQWWGLEVGDYMCNVDHGRRERGLVLIW